MILRTKQRPPFFAIEDGNEYLCLINNQAFFACMYTFKREGHFVAIAQNKYEIFPIKFNLHVTHGMWGHRG